MKLSEIRQQYPQYNHLSDGDLLMGLYRSDYTHVHPKTFLSQIEGSENAHVTIQNPELKKLWFESVTKPVEGESNLDRDVRLYGADQSIGQGETAMRGALQGATFGFGDEIVARGASLVGDYPYEAYLQAERDNLARGRKQHPVTAYGSEIAGGVVLPLGTAKNVLQHGGKVTKTAKAAGLGGTMGGVYAFGQGEGGFENRLNDARKGAAIGGVGGAAALPVAHYGQKAFPALQALFSKQGRMKRAENIIADNADTQLTQEALNKAVREGQNEFMIADAMGDSGQRMLSGVVRSTPEVAEDVTQKLNARQAGQSNRVSNFIADAFDSPQSAKATKESMEQARSEAANVNYQAARDGANPVDVRNTVSTIDDRVMGMQGSNVTPDSIDMKLLQYRNRLASPNPEKSKFPNATAVELSDFDRVMGVKRDLQDAIGVAVRAGRNNEARELTRIAKELDNALEQSSDGYRLANGSFAKASREIDQIDAGKTATGARTRAEDNIRYFENLTDAEKAAYRTGYADPLIAKAENSAVGVNAARPLTSQKFQQETQAMATDPALLNRRLDRENQMFKTNQMVTGGSRTADNMVDVDSANLLSNDSVLSKLLQLRLTDVATDAVPTVANMARGRGAKTKADMAKVLTTQGEGGSDLIKRLMVEKQIRDRNLRRLQSRGAVVGGFVSGQQAN